MAKRIWIAGALIVLTSAAFVLNSYAQAAEEAMKNGTALIRQNKFDDAIVQFNKVIAADPKSAVAYYNLGVAYDRKSDLTQAILHFTKAIEIDQAFMDAYHNRAGAYYKKGAFDKAIADYNKAIEIGPDSADCHYGLGLVYSKKNDLDKAISEYTKAIKLRPGFALAYSGRAVIYVTKKNYLAALSDVNKAQALGSRSRPPKRATAPGVAGEAEKNIVSAPDNGFSQAMQAHVLILKVVAVLFLFISFMHLLRLIFRVRVTVGKFTIPVWVSLMGFLIPLALSLWIFALFR